MPTPAHVPEMLNRVVPEYIRKHDELGYVGTNNN